MRKTLAASVGALALAVATATPALATEEDSGYGGTSTNLTLSADCGEFIIEWTNNTPDTFWGDYRIGDEEGKWNPELSGKEITEGPLAGQKFGPVYHHADGSKQGFPIAPGKTVERPVHVNDGEGSVDIMAWVRRGPEQKAYSMDGPLTVERCAPEDTTTPPPANDGDDTGDDTTPPTSGDDTTPPAEEPGDDTKTGGDDAATENGDDATDSDNAHDDGADESNEDGTAPTPEPQEAHIAVTG